MNIIVVDDEQFALLDLQEAISEALPGSEVHCFDTPSQALSHAEGNRVDVAFLDIEMGGMDGLSLAKNLKDIYGGTNIVFVTGYSHYAVDAFAMHASGYILKPATAEAVSESIEHLRHPVAPGPAAPLYIRTFGNFEVFSDGKPMRFPRAKSKEVFAYLVHKNGASCTVRELAAALEENSQSNMQTYVYAMIKALEEAGHSGVIVKSYNSVAVDTSKFDCDYYRFLNGDAAAVNAYLGEYMAQYSWAEFTAAFLDGKANNF